MVSGSRFMQETSMPFSGLKRKTPSRADAWAALADRVGGRFEKGSLLQGTHDRVTYREGHWTLVLDMNQDTASSETRIRLPFRRRKASENLCFSLHRKTLGIRLMSMLFKGDLETEYADFDEAMALNGHSPEILLPLFRDDVIRDLCLLQPDLDLSIREEYGFLKSTLPHGISEICFRESGEVRDVHRLMQLCGLCFRILRNLADMGFVSHRSPGIRLLSGPAGDHAEHAWEEVDEDDTRE